jgi:channel protein (hemolysin III family)
MLVWQLPHLSPSSKLPPSSAGQRLRCAGTVTLLLYGLSSIWLFGCSAAYHLVNWSPTRRELLRALDHGNIYVVTAATWTAVGANVLDGWQRLVLLVTV